MQNLFVFLTKSNQTKSNYSSSKYNKENSERQCIYNTVETGFLAVNLFPDSSSCIIEYVQFL